MSLVRRVLSYSLLLSETTLAVPYSNPPVSATATLYLEPQILPHSPSCFFSSHPKSHHTPVLDLFLSPSHFAPPRARFVDGYASVHPLARNLSPRHVAGEHSHRPRKAKCLCHRFRHGPRDADEQRRTKVSSHGRGEGGSWSRRVGSLRLLLFLGRFFSVRYCSFDMTPPFLACFPLSLSLT